MSNRVSVAFISGVIIGLIVATGATIVYAWTGPTATAPNGNVAAPINTSATTQTKTGSFTVSGVFTIANGLFNSTAGGTVLDANGRWIRTYGVGGWYNQTYAGGWYMADSTWIRNYGSKQVYLDNNIYATAFYDTNNSAYYLDPNGVSRLNDIRPNIMYDGQNTGYYVDPDNTTNLYRLCLVGACRTNWPYLGGEFYANNYGGSYSNTTLACPSGSVLTTVTIGGGDYGYSSALCRYLY